MCNLCVWWCKGVACVGVGSCCVAVHKEMSHTLAFCIVERDTGLL